MDSNTKVIINRDTLTERNEDTTSVEAITDDCAEIEDMIEDFEIDIDNDRSENTVEDLHHLQRILLSWHSINVHADLPRPPLLKRILNKKARVKSQTKQILFDVDGVVKPGTLLAIMGSSGAGKTTLMNVLAHRNIKNIHVDGLVKVNKKVIGRRIKRFSAYVQQEDLFMGVLTVREHLMFQAILRIDKAIPKSEKLKQVESAITELGLRKCENSLIGIPGKIRGISGGELKRLAFASEMLTNPSLLFVDEPTSGLDSFMAMNVITSLQNLAKSGRTILATIHQPSSDVFAKFDSILLMSEGRVAFMGSTADCGQFFEECGYDLPPNYNPSDFYIKTLAIVPGSEDVCKKRALGICSQFENRKYQKVKRSLSNLSATEDRKIEHRKYKVGVAEQFKTVLKRSFTKMRRDPALNYIKIFIRLIMAFVIGLVFFQQKNDQKSIQNINGVIFFMSLGTAMSTYGPSLLTLSVEFPIFLKEHRIAMYRVDVYYLANMLAELPVNIISQTLQNVIVYWLAGLRNDAVAFFNFCGITLLLSQASLAYAYTVSALIPHPKVLASVGNLFIFPLIIFGGLFVNVGSIPVFLDWLKYLSFVRYGFEALSINQWKTVTSIDCAVNATVPCIPNGPAVLESLSVVEGNFHLNIYLLVVLIVAFRVTAYLLLFARAWRK